MQTKSPRKSIGFRGESILDFEIEARALNGVGANLAVSHCYMLRMNSVALQSLLAFECTVEHQVGVRRCQATIDVYFYIKQTGNLAYQSLKTCLDFCLYLLFLLFREFWIQSPENNVLYHTFIIISDSNVAKIGKIICTTKKKSQKRTGIEVFLYICKKYSN